jgi:hypothetical protein
MWQRPCELVQTNVLSCARSKSQALTKRSKTLSRLFEVSKMFRQVVWQSSSLKCVVDISAYS